MWFSNLSLIEQVAFVVACIGSAFFLFKIIFLIFGLSDFTDICFGVGRGATVFLFQGFISLMAVGGWITFAASRGGFNWWASLLIGLGAGLAGMAVILLLYGLMAKMEHEGTLQMQSGVGKTAEVYLVIPAKSNGNGKITFTLQGRAIEANAVTKGTEAIKTGESVNIIGYENNTYIVEKL